MIFVLPLAGALSIAGVAQAVVVPGVYNTGLGVGGSALAAGDGQVDANYVVVSSTRVCLHLSRMSMAARCTADRKFLASLS
jgi:hypothetical protein